MTGSNKNDMFNLTLPLNAYLLHCYLCYVQASIKVKLKL